MDELRAVFLEQRQMSFIWIKLRLTLRDSGFDKPSHRHRDVLIRFPMPEMDRRLNVLQTKTVVRDRQQGLMECAARPLPHGFAHCTNESLLNFGVGHHRAIRFGQDGSRACDKLFWRDARHDAQHHPQEQAREERLLARHGQELARPSVDICHQF